MTGRSIKSGTILFLAVICLSFVIKYNFLLHEKENDAEINAEKIYAILADSFDQTEKILTSIGKKIVEEAPDLKPQDIHKIFVETQNLNHYDNIFSWSLFDWVNVDGFQTVNTVIGIRKNPPQMGPERNYLNRGNEPWKVIFSSGATGNPSGIYVIPAGIQVESKKLKRAGALSVGIAAKKLSSIIESRLDKNLNFLLVDQRNDQVTLGSYNSDQNLGKIIKRMPQSLNGKRYIYEKRMDPQYPYKIWVGYDLKEFWREVGYSSLLLAIQIIGVASCVIFVTKRSGH